MDAKKSINRPATILDNLRLSKPFKIPLRTPYGLIEINLKMLEEF